MKIFFTFLLLTFYTLNLAAQSSQVKALVEQVNDLQKQRLSARNGENREEVWERFTTKVNELFMHPDYCNTPLDFTDFPYIEDDPTPENKELHYLPYLFMNRIVTCVSEDKQLRVFSWDELGGGSYHSYINFIQFADGDQSCQVIPFQPSESNPEEGGAEVGYYEVKQVQELGRTFYFLFGYGTYGSGKQHKVLRIFEIKKGQLTECLDCYPNKMDLVVYTNRGSDSELDFNPEIQELSYKAYVMDEDVGFFTQEYNWVRLRFENGQLK